MLFRLGSWRCAASHGNDDILQTECTMVDPRPIVPYFPGREVELELRFQYFLIELGSVWRLDG